MDSRYAQVWMSYYRRWGLRLTFASVIVLTLLVPVVMRLALYGIQKRVPDAIELPDPLVRYSYVGILTMGLAWLMAASAGHMKEQLADWRARLIPHYRTPHLVVGAIVTLMLVIVLPVAAGLTVRVSPAGLMAIVAVNAAFWAWMVHLQNVWIVFAWIGSFFLLAIPQTHVTMVTLLEGTATATISILIAVSLIALAALLARLGRMHEEMFEYFRLNLDSNQRLRPSMTGDATQRRIGEISSSHANLSITAADLSMRRIRNIRDAGIFAQARHWRLANGTALGPWIVGILMAAAALLFAPADNDGRSTLICTLLVLTVLPMVVSACFWIARWPMLGIESTRPMDRGRFVRVVLAALAWDGACAFFALSFIAAVTLAIRWPHALLSVARALTLVVAIQVFLIAGAIWVLRLRSTWIFILAMQALIPLLAFLIPALEHGKDQSMSWLLPRTMIFILCGVVVAFDAYRRWLKTDLD